MVKAAAGEAAAVNEKDADRAERAGAVGTNVSCNRIKRRIREAFRLNRERMPTGAGGSTL